MEDSLRDLALRQAAACAREKYPGEAKRLDKGLVLALNHHVAYQEDGSAHVQSESNPEITYHVVSGTCDCPDHFRAPDGRCKHRFAAFLVRLAYNAELRLALNR